MALINLNDTTPGAPSGFQNAKWQADSSSPRNVSAYIPGSGGVLVKTADYTAVAADCGKLIVFNSSGAHTLTLPAAAPFAQWNIGVQNIGTGVVTILPNGLNLDGAASSLTLAQTQGLGVSTDATNYFTERGAGSVAASFGGVSVKTADYTAVTGDSGKLLVMNSGSAHTITLPSSPPSSTWVIGIQNVGAGTLTVSRGGLTIDAAASDLSVATGQGMLIWCDGSNYFTERSSLPASPSDATKFLNGASSPAFAQVKDSDLSTSDVTTNNVSTSKHGFAPKAPNDATKFLDGTGAYSVPAGAVTLTTKGDILTFGSGQVRLPVGTNGLVLTADSSATNGLAWESVPTATTSVLGLVKPDGTTITIAGGVISSIAGSQPYDVVYAYPGAQPNSTTIQLLTFPRTVAFPANFTGSYAHVGGNPTSTQSFTLNKNGTSCGTVTVNTSGSFSFATSGGSTLTFNAGDTLSITTPPADATLSSVTITLAGTR